MNIEVLARQWLDALARLWLGWWDGRRARHSLTLRDGEDGLIVRDGSGAHQSFSGSVLSEQALPSELVRAAQRAYVMLELGRDETVARRMSVPAQARDLLPGIVRNQIERLSPWRAAQAYYGFEAQPGADPTTLDVRILITPRATVDEACQRLAAQGVTVDVVLGEASAGAVRLWSRLGEADGVRVRRLRWSIGGAIAAVVGIAVALNIWAFLAGAAAETESEEIGAEIARLQRQVKGTYSPQSIAALPVAERAWALKETSVVAAILIEALSRALPDSAYLTELNIEGTTVRIAGIATDAPALIAPLEQSGPFKEVHFYAPTTRSADGARFIFHIEARVEPHQMMAGG